MTTPNVQLNVSPLLQLAQLTESEREKERETQPIGYHKRPSNGLTISGAIVTDRTQYVILPVYLYILYFSLVVGPR